jgi:hypothetical protein
VDDDNDRTQHERDDGHADDWTGSPLKPWLNPPMRKDKKFGVMHGSWRYGIIVIVVAIVAVIVVLALVNAGKLSDGWAYAVLPIAIIAAAASRVLTIFKAGAEDQSD